MNSNIIVTLLLSSLLGVQPAERNYIVVVDAGNENAFLPAAQELARFHKGKIVRFDASKLEDCFADLKKLQPDYVAFVLPPEKIDVDLVHRMLELSAKLDDDPFPDFAYGFVTGRDGKAALQFVERIKAAWQKKYGGETMLFGSWEGAVMPKVQSLSAMKAHGARAEIRMIRTGDDENQRKETARQALQMCKGKDLLLFFSHGYPDEMAMCFSAKDLHQWQPDLTGSVLINCACYNGVTGRWFAPSRKGVEDKGLVKPEDSVALAVLDAGAAGYFAGIDPWHGPLAFQLFGYVFDEGLPLGEAARMMYNRLALEFLPERIHYPPTLTNPKRFAGEGTNNRRHNGAGMIFYGDPALAPFKDVGKQRMHHEVKMAGDGLTITLEVKPLIDGQPDVDFMIPMNRLIDYYSVKSQNFAKELSLEVYRRIPAPKSMKQAPKLRVTSARSGKQDVPTRTPQVVLEENPRGNFLHVRVPLDVRAFGNLWTMTISREGMRIGLKE